MHFRRRSVARMRYLAGFAFVQSIAAVIVAYRMLSCATVDLLPHFACLDIAIRHLDARGRLFTLAFLLATLAPLCPT
ncbi:hypothetical protein PUN4_640066 [Paraburkholderia unamae]|nr:hypothetical protein PUN4_640066 [Paraburkholderia unamae]